MKAFRQIKNIVVSADMEEGTVQVNKVLHDMQNKSFYQIHDVTRIKEVFFSNGDNGVLYQINYQITEISPDSALPEEVPSEILE